MPRRRSVDELAKAIRRAAEEALAPDDVRFERGSERPLGRKGRRTRANILKAAAEVFQEAGWSGASIAAIADRASVGVGTVYQYFRSKEEMVAAIVGEWTVVSLSEVRAWNPEEGIDGLRRLIHRFVTMYATTAAFQRLWEEVSLVDAALGRLRDDVTELFVNLFAESFMAASKVRLLDAGPDPVETSRAVNAMIERYCLNVFVRHSSTLTPNQVAELLTDLVLGALRVKS
jgi:AcrR family transcriptional regulator